MCWYPMSKMLYNTTLILELKFACNLIHYQCFFSNDASLISDFKIENEILTSPPFLLAEIIKKQLPNFEMVWSLDLRWMSIDYKGNFIHISQIHGCK